MPTAAISRCWRYLRLLASVFALAPSPGFSQPEGAAAARAPAPPPPPGVEEIVIVGERSSLEVGADEMVSITQFDAGALEAMGVDSIADLAPYTPNLEIRSVGATATTFFIRGVGLNDFTANAAGAVAIYNDDVQLNLPAFQNALLFDMASAEVLKGPQGTGSSRNASAGAIKSYSKKPSGEFESYWRADYGNLDALDVEGALELPLLDDLLAIRTAFRVRQRDGLFENRCGGLTQQEIDAANGPLCNSQGNATIRPGLPEELSDIDTWAARQQLRFRPPEIDMDWIFSVHGGRVDQIGNGGVHLGAVDGNLGAGGIGQYVEPEVQAEFDSISADFPTPPTPQECNRRGPPGSPARVQCLAERTAILNARRATLSRSLARRPLDTDPFSVDVNRPGYERMETVGGSLRGEWQLPEATLSTLTAYEHYDREREIDADYASVSLLEFQIEDRAWQVSQELGAKGELEALPVEWQTGAYVLIEELTYHQIQFPSFVLPQVNQNYLQKSLGAGVFGQFSWEFLDDFSLEGGVRYNYERKTIDAEISRQKRDSCAAPPALPTIKPDCSLAATYHQPTGSVGLKYYLREDLSTYWKYTRGWKGPQYNVRDGLRPAFPVDLAKPEKLDSFEIGFHGSWFDERLSLGGAAFWYLYENYQIFVVTNDASSPPQRVVINANDAQLYGAELEATLEPTEALLMDLRVGWLESKFLDFSDTGFRQQDDPNSNQTVAFFFTNDYNGNRLPNTPRFKVSASAQYTLELGRYGEIVPRYELNWSDEVFFDPSEGRGAPSVVTNQPVLPDHTISERPLLLHNVRLTYRMADGGLELSGWVRNLTDEVYKSYAFDASSAANFVGNLVGEPRTYGLSVKLTF